MKKYSTLLFAIVCLINVVSGQTFATFSDDFESYKTGDWLAQTSSVWTTWSGTPSTSGDDVKIANTDAFSGTKSLYFGAGPGPNDVVLPFGGVRDDGQFVYKSMMKIPSGKSAYFNFQGDNVVGSTWAVEVTFKIDSTVVFSNLTSGTMFTAKYPQGKWFEMKIYVNLKRNEWHVYIDKEYLGYFANSVNRVSFLDIYPIDKNSEYWVDDVSFVYAPPSPNNAGIELLTSPSPITAACGANDVKVRLANNGDNTLDSVRIYWMVDGVMQKPVFVNKAVDTSYSKSRMEVTLNSALHLSNGLHRIKAWTAFPNGVADTLNFDDTLRATVKAQIRGISLDYATPFQGKKVVGSLASPDSVCAGDTITYSVTPPTGYKNSDLGTGWLIKKVEIKSNGIAAMDTLTLRPSGSTNYRFRYMADTSEGGKLFKLEISVSVGSGCDTVLTQYFYVNKLPHVAFTANDACVGKGVFFTNTSKGAGKNQYLWKFGDGSSSKFMNTSKFYNNPGIYNVTLRATNPSGCKATKGLDVTVYDIPVSKFGSINACHNSDVVFSDSSTVGIGKITKYFWEFGDGDTDNVKNTTHTYASAGTYTARLTVTTNQGCFKKSPPQTVVVYPVPSANFTGVNTCDSNAVVFSNTTKYTGTDILTYDWDFGDGSHSATKNPDHLYGLPGQYLVNLKVATTEDCIDSIQLSVEVYPLPVADFSMDNSCLGDSSATINSSSVSSGNIASYAWTFGDGNTSNDMEPVHKYAKTGTYSVQIIVTSDEGCTDATTNMVSVFPRPKAKFTLNNACVNKDVTVDNQSTTTSDTLSYVWSFGDGNVSMDKSPTNIYSKDGTYKVQLLVYTENMCNDSIEKSVEIYPLPVAGFTYPHITNGLYTFKPDDSTLVAYDWDFGDGNTSKEISTNHEFASAGDYDVTLTTTDSNGCTASNTIKLTVRTGIEEVNQPANPFQVFPNPFRENVNIVYQLQKAGNVTIEVYGIDGKLLETLVKQKQSQGDYQYKFNTPGASGIYMVRMVIDDYVYHERIVKAQ